MNVKFNETHIGKMLTILCQTQKGMHVDIQHSKLIVTTPTPHAETRIILRAVVQQVRWSNGNEDVLPGGEVENENTYMHIRRCNVTNKV